MGTSGLTQPSPDDWKRVSQAIVRRREQRGWTQADVAARGGLSLDRVQAIERGRGMNVRPKTLISLTRGLEWSVSSIDKILKGRDPVPIEELRGEGLLLEAVWIVCDAAATRLRSHVYVTKQRLWPAIDSRLEELRLSNKQLAWRADLDPLNILDGHLSPRGAERLAQSLAGALQWTEDSVSAVLDGKKPQPIPYPVLYPSEFDRVVEPIPDPPGGPRRVFMSSAPPSAEMQAEFARGLASLIPTTPPYDDVRIILESGLPSGVQRNLITHMATRRAEMDAALRREAQLLVEQLRLGVQSVSREGRERDDARARLHELNIESEHLRKVLEEAQQELPVKVIPRPSTEEESISNAAG